MAKTYVIIDLDKKFEGLTFTPVILNEIEAVTLEDREALNKLIITTYDNVDKLSPVPSCTCNYLQFGHNLHQLCPKCNTRVEPPSELSIESSVWFRTPDDIDGFINPTVYLILREAFTFNRFSLLDWLLCPGWEKPKPKNRWAYTNVERLVELGVPRGLNNFIRHFDKIFDILMSMIPRSKRTDLYEFVRQWKDNFFPRHIPMPAKIAFVIEKTSVGNYADLTMREAIDAARNMASLTPDDYRQISRLENKMVNIVRLIGEYNAYMLGKPLSPKEGWYRRHCFGMRKDFSHRSVIVSDPGVHDYESIKIPFTQACVVLRPQLQNLLKKHRGMTTLESGAFIDANCQERYTENGQYLEQLLHELMASTHGGNGIWTLWIRYPTLEMASIQCMRITGLLDRVSSLSPLAVKGPNADSPIHY